MKLEPLTLDQCQQVRIWRNDCLETLRTPYPLTESQQAEFYQDVVCNRNSPHRYFAITGEQADYPVGALIKTKDIAKPEIPNFFLGMGGLTHIQWENSIAEISLILDPKRRRQGLGEKAVDLLLDHAFNHLNLQTVFGECYHCNEAANFWLEITRKKKGRIVVLPNRKFWKGVYYPSSYFSIDKEDFNNVKSNS